jgi:cytoskeletal protein RodZ
MGDLGILLREAREKRGISLEKAEADTRIRYKFLLALENEDYSVLPGQVYIKGFLKTYASYLGLDPAQVVGLYKASVAPPESEKLPEVPLVQVPIEGPRSLAPYIAGLAIVAGVLLLAAAYFRAPWRAWLGLVTPTPYVQPTSVSAPTATILPTALPTATTQPTSSPTAGPTSTATPTRPAGTRVVLQFVVTGRSWVQIVADGEVAYSGLLENVTREWTAQGSIVARIGNAGAVDVTVNGEHVGVLGADGEVVVQEWTAEGAAVTPTPAATTSP